MLNCDYLCAIAHVLYSVVSAKVVVAEFFSNVFALVHCVPFIAASEGALITSSERAEL